MALMQVRRIYGSEAEVMSFLQSFFKSPVYTEKISSSVRNESSEAIV